MSVPTLEKLKNLKKKLEESSKQIYTGAKLQPTGGKDFTATKKSDVKENPRKEGVSAADKKWEASQVKQGSDGIKQNPRKEGVSAADKKWDAEQVKQGAVVEANPRKEGVSAADHEWLSPAAFREKIRGELGLSLNDKLNKGNDGLNKGKPSGSVEGNKAGTPVK